MFKNQPKGLFALALANTGERFGYYTMLAIFMLFLQAKFGWEQSTASQVYSIFLAAVYFMPVVGGWLADKIGFGKCVVTGICVMFIGYLVLAVPTAANGFGVTVMLASLLLIAVGTGLFKGNLQVLVGNLYDDPRYASKRDSAFSLFYMAINIGSMFAPAAATAITNKFLAKAGLIYKAAIPALAHQQMAGTITPEGAEQLNGLMAMMPDANAAGMGLDQFCPYYIDKLSASYNMGFAVACISLVVSIAIYFATKSWFKHADVNAKQAKTSGGNYVELTPKQTKERIVALCLVFAVVIFFWMAFHQNGNTLTLFARDFTQKTSEGLQSMAFDVTNLVACIFVVYGSFGLAQSKTGKGKGISFGVIVAAIAFLFYKYNNLEGAVAVEAPIFQQFNPCYVVALTPVSVALFSWLNKIGKEPTSPEKIGLGMLVAALGFVWMAVGSMGLELPLTQGDPATEGTRVSANLLISTYLILTFAELLLSPIGISFVTKVAPPKYAGLMMGLWFGATAIGNQLVMVPGIMWGKNFNLVTIWGVLAGICLVSALFIFSIIKKLNKVS